MASYGLQMTPASDAKIVTPADATDLPEGTTKSILVGVAGDLAVVTEGGTSITLPVVVGYNPLRVKQIEATNTTATNIFALY